MSSTTVVRVKACSHCRRSHHTVCTGRAWYNASGTLARPDWKFVACSCFTAEHRPGG